MDSLLTAAVMLGVFLGAASEVLPKVPSTDYETSAMAVVSAEYYNRGSNEESLFQLHDTDAYYMDTSSSPQKLRFVIKETLCKKSAERIADQCDFKEDGMVKTCTATFFAPEGDRVILVICDSERRGRLRVRRSRGDRGGGNRGGRGGGRGNSRGSSPGRGSSIAGVGSRGNSGTRTA
ncbi:cathelicidin-related peptide Pt_CRAMP2-like [Spea bombifrons]|uniref:cathelicidin-related peptide Pt_CRAMP2-like n=1 Tax=Spea bombifrons TaxID=233779 RepID=UPI0023499D88|nr:cathelicidin-related peptide Pt_CRAMP2-like [Spea bombifrons]